MADRMNDDRTEHAESEPPSGAPAEREARLGRLDDYEVEDGYPDIRGWPVRGSNGRELGVVGELLVDTDLMEVAAVDVHLGVGAAGVRGNVIASSRVPIESVRIQQDRYVIVDVAALACEDVVEAVGDGTGAVRRVPCGQIGIRKRDDAARAAWTAAHGHDVEITRPASLEP